MSTANKYSLTIMHMISKGYTLEKIHELTGVLPSYLKKNFGVYFRAKWQRPMGYKDGPYYDSEDEMFKKSVYTYKSLSKSEKAIYNDMAGDK